MSISAHRANCSDYLARLAHLIHKPTVATAHGRCQQTVKRGVLPLQPLVFGNDGIEQGVKFLDGAAGLAKRCGHFTEHPALRHQPILLAHPRRRCVATSPVQ